MHYYACRDLFGLSVYWKLAMDLVGALADTFVGAFDWALSESHVGAPVITLARACSWAHAAAFYNGILIC